MNVHAQQLVSPPISKVTTIELFDEVEEYFAAGAEVKAGDTVVDVGANIGAFAVRVAMACGGDVRLLEFEPSPETFAALSANFARHESLQKTRYTLFHLGLSSAEHAGQTLSFYDFSRFPTNSTFHLSEKRREFEIFFEDRGQRMASRMKSVLPGGLGRGLGAVVEGTVSALPKGSLGWWFARKIMGLREHVVRVDTLSRVIAAENVERIDLLKIDVEGSEVEILRGVDAPTWAKIKQVVMETHDRDGRLAEIEGDLRTHGLTQIKKVLQKTVDNGLESILLHAKRG